MTFKLAVGLDFTRWLDRQTFISVMKLVYRRVSKEQLDQYHMHDH